MFLNVSTNKERLSFIYLNYNTPQLAETSNRYVIKIYTVDYIFVSFMKMFQYNIC